MENWWTNIPWGWIVAVVVLYLIGVFEGRATGYRKRKKEEQKEKANQPPREPETVTVKETVTVRVDDPGLLRVKLEDQGVVLDLDGARVNPISLLPEQRKRLIEILSIIRPWLEGKLAPTPSVTASPTPPGAGPVQPATLPPLMRPQPSPASAVPPAATPSLLDRIQTTPVPQPASPPPLANPQPAASKPATIAKDDRPAAPAGSMVEQIDAILQTRLIGTPLEERGIFLTQSPEGGVNVYVGLTRYGGVDEVPDPEIKAAIRAAITEWEHKFTPGLR